MAGVGRTGMDVVARFDANLPSILDPRRPRPLPIGSTRRRMHLRHISRRDRGDGASGGQHRHFGRCIQRLRILITCARPSVQPAAPLQAGNAGFCIELHHHAIRQLAEARRIPALHALAHQPVPMQHGIDLPHEQSGAGRCTTPAAHACLNAANRSRRHSLHGRCPAASAVTSSRKNNSVYWPGAINGRRRSLNCSRQVTQSRRLVCVRVRRR